MNVSSGGCPSVHIKGNAWKTSSEESAGQLDVVAHARSHTQGGGRRASVGSRPACTIQQDPASKILQGKKNLPQKVI